MSFSYEKKATLWASQPDLADVGEQISALPDLYADYERVLLPPERSIPISEMQRCLAVTSDEADVAAYAGMQSQLLPSPDRRFLYRFHERSGGCMDDLDAYLLQRARVRDDLGLMCALDRERKIVNQVDPTEASPFNIASFLPPQRRS